MKQSSFVGDLAEFLREEIRYKDGFTLLHALLAPHSPPTVLQGMVVLEDELLEAEVRLEGEVVLQVGGGEYIPVQYKGLAGHELHKPLAEVPNQPLL